MLTDYHMIEEIEEFIDLYAEDGELYVVADDGGPRHVEHCGVDPFAAETT